MAVVDADNTVQIRGVKVGERIGNLWVIREGLAPGDRVVAEGTQKVGNGVKITPKPLRRESRSSAESIRWERLSSRDDRG